MIGVVDFHSHILPGIDDGSVDVAQSLAMLRKEAEQGICHVVATPHFYAAHNDPGRFLEKRKTAEETLREALAGFPELPGLTVGAEVHYFPGMSESDILQEMTIGGRSHILVEMPLCRWTDRMYRELESIYEKQGLTPIVAHVERYIRNYWDREIPKTLAHLPVLVQANGAFFREKTTRANALRMLRRGEIHLLGSDCHDLSERAPDLGETISVIEKRLPESALQRVLTHQNEVLGL